MKTLFLAAMLLMVSVVSSGSPCGNPNRIIKATPKQDPHDIPGNACCPPMINAWFLCGDINNDCEPWTGFVLVRGIKFSCQKLYDNSDHEDLGTIAPNAERTITIPIDKE